MRILIGLSVLGTAMLSAAGAHAQGGGPRTPLEAFSLSHGGRSALRPTQEGGRPGSAKMLALTPQGSLSIKNNPMLIHQINFARSALVAATLEKRAERKRRARHAADKNDRLAPPGASGNHHHTDTARKPGANAPGAEPARTDPTSNHRGGAIRRWLKRVLYSLADRL